MDTYWMKQQEPQWGKNKSHPYTIKTFSTREPEEITRKNSSSSFMFTILIQNRNQVSTVSIPKSHSNVLIEISLQS